MEETDYHVSLVGLEHEALHALRAELTTAGYCVDCDKPDGARQVQIWVLASAASPYPPSGPAVIVLGDGVAGPPRSWLESLPGATVGLDDATPARLVREIETLRRVYGERHIGPTPTPPETGRPDKLRILHVEDSAVDRKVVEAILRAEGPRFSLVSRASVEQGLDAARQHEFDAILLDHELPDGHGIDALQGLRAEGVTTPVIVVTASESDQVAAGYIEAGATDFIAKSDVTRVKLIRTLELCCAAARRQSHAPS